MTTCPPKAGPHSRAVPPLFDACPSSLRNDRDFNGALAVVMLRAG